MPRPRSQGLTDAELRVMNVLWERGRASVGEVVDGIAAPAKPAYNTVLTTLRILERKGYVTHEKDGRAFYLRCRSSIAARSGAARCRTSCGASSTTRRRSSSRTCSGTSGSIPARSASCSTSSRSPTTHPPRRRNGGVDDPPGDVAVAGHWRSRARPRCCSRGRARSARRRVTPSGGRRSSAVALLPFAYVLAAHGGIRSVAVVPDLPLADAAVPLPAAPDGVLVALVRRVGDRRAVSLARIALQRARGAAAEGRIDTAEPRARRPPSDVERAGRTAAASRSFASRATCARPLRWASAVR